MDHSNPRPLAALAVASPEGGQRGSIGAPPDDDTLYALESPALDPLFWPAERLGAPSAWWQHVPFAHWIVRAAAPRVLVELGTHAGVSYAAFCQAVARERLGTRCHAVDTWRGDPHAGEYGEEVYNELRRFHDERYGTFSTLLRCTFDAALDHIADGSVDLLHIDGLHTYEAVHHDFESWTPKLSNRAVVLFHDTNERGGDFGVWRFWGELSERFPSFELLHGHGLGVLAVGDHMPSAVSALCALQGASAASLRGRFARLGERWLHEIRAQEQAVRTQAQAARAERAEAAAAGAFDRAERAEAAAAEATARAETEAARVEAAAAEATARAETEAARVEAAATEVVARAEAAAAEAFAREEHAKAAATRLGNVQETMRAEAARRAAAARREAAEAIARAERAEGAVAEAAARAERTTVAATETAARAEAEVARFHHDLARAASERDALLASTVWRATRPLRTAGERMPAGLRRAARGGAKLAWWTMTLKLPRMLRQRRRLLQEAAERAAAPPSEAPPPPQPVVAPEAAPERLPSAPVVVRAAPGDRSDAPRLVYISGESDTPGHLYRVVRPAAAAAATGARVTWMRPDEAPERLAEIEAADAVLIWRAAWDERVAAAVGAARRGGAKVVFDVDDLMVDPGLARLDIIDGIRSQDLNEELVRDHYQRVRNTMAAADLCVAATEELAAHMRHAGMPTVVLPNGFDHATLAVSRLAARRRRAAGPGDGLVRIGYAGGSRTHQRDFALCADSVAAVLRARADCRLVLFRSADGSSRILDVEEFPALRGLEDRIEWRYMVPLEQLPEEVARFDVNLAPLEVGNPFCEAKSELKFFEAALADVPTIASPTGPFRRAIRHGETGFLAAAPGQWRAALERLVDNAALRRRVAEAARRDVLWTFGPERRAESMASLIDLLRGGRAAARAFQVDALRRRVSSPADPHIPAHEVVFEADHLDFGLAEVSVVVPLYNYAGYVIETLESVRAQSLRDIDLIVVDDRSTDDSLAVALDWVKANAARFNRVSVLRNRANSGLAFTRNVGFDAADTPFVLPLDADNRLLPDCAAACLRAARATGAAFAYPLIRRFGAGEGLVSEPEYDPVRLANGNYIDAMALVSKAAWAAVGGYDHIRGGWEDFDLWCRLVEWGLRGERVPGGPLAEYRMHNVSMIHTAMARHDTVRRMMDELDRRHPWLTLVWPLPGSSYDERTKATPVRDGPPGSGDRLARLLPLLRCPETGGRLAVAPENDALVSEDGSRRWPLALGRPLLFPGMDRPADHPDTHARDPLPASALALIRGTSGPVLHLGAKSSAERFDHVVEAEAAVFRHTDLVADAHRLPFADEAFDAVLALNAFERYRDPRRAAREILRVLRPGGRVLVRAAFLQPLHDAPWHFYNCTRQGLEAWFEEFDTEALRVSDNFHPGHSLAWIASECEAALRKRLSGEAADAFSAAPIGRLASLWRSPEEARNGEPLWEDLAALPQDAQEAVAAGFEYIGRRPAR